VSKSRTGGGRKQTMTATAGGAPAAVYTVLATTMGELTVVPEGGSLTGLNFQRH
jgi:hypothetical protein